MGLRINGKAKVWQIEEKEGAKGKHYYKIQMSTSRKDKASNSWITDFQSYAFVFGDAFQKLKGRLERGSSIIVRDFEITKTYVKAQGKEYLNVSIYDADLIDANGNVIVNISPEQVEINNRGKKKTEDSAPTPSQGFMNIADDLPDLPFN